MMGKEERSKVDIERLDAADAIRASEPKRFLDAYNLSVTHEEDGDGCDNGGEPFGRPPSFQDIMDALERVVPDGLGVIELDLSGDGADAKVWRSMPAVPEMGTDQLSYRMLFAYRSHLYTATAGVIPDRGDGHASVNDVKRFLREVAMYMARTEGVAPGWSHKACPLDMVEVLHMSMTEA